MTVGRVNLRGQSVLLDTKTLDLRMQARKLTSRFVGPFKVLEPLNRLTTTDRQTRIACTSGLTRHMRTTRASPNISIQPNIYRMTYGTTTTQYDISYRLSAASYCDGAVAAGRVYKQWGIGLTCHCRPACAQGWPRPRLRPALLELELQLVATGIEWPI